MAQSGYSPVKIYGSNTSGNVPLAASLANDSGGVELAINTADGKIFFKNSGGVVQTINNGVSSVSATVPSFLSVSGVPITGTGTIAISLSGTALPVSSGGSGATTLTGLLKGNGTSAFTAAVAGTDYVSPTVLGAASGVATLDATSKLTTSQLPSNVVVSGANSNITSLSGLTTALTVAQGGTGVATLTGIPYASGTAAFAAATGAQIATAIGTSAVTNAGNVATVADTTSTTAYLPFVAAATGNNNLHTSTTITVNAVTGVITSGIAGGTF